MELSIDLKLPKTALMHGGPKALDIVADEVLKATWWSLSKLETAAARGTPVNMGTLRAGTRTEIRGRKVSIVGRVVNPLSYALPVETGSSKRWFPPVAPIALWAKRRFGVDEREAQQIGFLVARAISKRGLSGAHMFKAAKEQNETAIQTRFDQALLKMVARLSRES